MDELKSLINKYLEGKASNEEQLTLEQWYASSEANKGIYDQMSEEERAAVSRKMLHTINECIKKTQRSSNLL